MTFVMPTLTRMDKEFHQNPIYIRKCIYRPKFPNIKREYDVIGYPNRKKWRNRKFHKNHYTGF